MMWITLNRELNHSIFYVAKDSFKIANNNTGLAIGMLYDIDADLEIRLTGKYEFIGE